MVIDGHKLSLGFWWSWGHYCNVEITKQAKNRESREYKNIMF